MPQPDSRSEYTVLVNGEVEPLPHEHTVSALLEDLGMSGRRVAVAVNRDVVPRGAYAKTELSHGDRVEILEAVGGG